MHKASFTAAPVWIILLALIYLRPFICESAFPFLGLWYNFFLIVFSLFYILVNKSRIKFTPSFFDYSVLLFFVIVLSSLFFSKFTRDKGIELTLFLPNVLLFLIAGQLKDEEAKQLLRVIFAAAIVVCIYTIYQYFFGFRHLEAYIKNNPADLPYPPEYLKMILARKRPFSTFLSPNVFSSYLLMMIFVGAGLFMDARTRKLFRLGRFGDWFILAGVIILVVSLFFAKALAAFFSFFIGLLLFIFIGIRFCGNVSKKDCRRIIVLFVCISVFLIGAALIFARNRIIQVASFSGQNNSLEQRWYYWLAALKMIKDHFLFGVGWGNFEVYYNLYRHPLANFSRYTHNLILQVFAETGIFGVLVLLGMAGLFIKNGLSAVKRVQDKYWLTASLFIAGLVFLFHNLFDISFYFGQSALFWWIILGLLNSKQKPASS